MYLYRVHKPGHTYTTTTRHEDKSAQNHLLCNHCRNGSRTRNHRLRTRQFLSTRQLEKRLRQSPFALPAATFLAPERAPDNRRYPQTGAGRLPQRRFRRSGHSAPLARKELDEWRNDTRHNARIHDRRLFRAIRGHSRMFGGAGNRSDPVRRHQFSERHGLEPDPR